MRTWRRLLRPSFPKPKRSRAPQASSPLPPSHQSCPRCQPRTHCCEHDQIATRDSALLDHRIERQRQGSTRGVAVLGQDSGHSLVRQPQAFSGSVQNSLICLMGDDQRQIRWLETVSLQDLLHALDHGSDCKLEYRPSVLLEEMLARSDRVDTRRQLTPAGGHLEVISSAPIYSMMEVENSVTWLGTLQECGACAITEQNSSGSIQRIDDGAHEIGSHHNDVAVCSAGDELRARREGVEKA